MQYRIAELQNCSSDPSVSNNGLACLYLSIAHAALEPRPAFFCKPPRPQIILLLTFFVKNDHNNFGGSVTEGNRCEQQT